MASYKNWKITVRFLQILLFAKEVGEVLHLSHLFYGPYLGSLQ